MRADTAGAKTWLLGAVALWALCVWVLTLFGLGGAVARLPEDPTIAGRLPSPPARVGERLGPLQQYAGIGDRPLFTEDRRPVEFLINPEGEASAQATFDYILTSVMRTPNFEMAILQRSDGSGEPVRIKVGGAPDAAPSWHLASLDARSAVFNGPEGERKLDLRVFDGTGGQSPTAVTVAPAVDPTAGRPANGVAASVGNPQTPRLVQPVQSGQASQPPVPSTPVAQADAAASPDKASAPDQTQQAQIDAIRKRIEERRNKLRQESQSSAPGQNP